MDHSNHNPFSVRSKVATKQAPNLLVSTASWTNISLHISLLYREEPEFIRELLKVCHAASQGQAIPCPWNDRPFETSREAEQAVICILLLHGWESHQIEQIFQEYKPRHFADNPSGLPDSIRGAIRFILSDPVRQNVLRWHQIVLASPWPYRGMMGKQVYLAILKKAFVDRTLEPRTPINYIWKYLPSATDAGIHKAMKSLERAGLIALLSDRYEPIEVRINDLTSIAEYPKLKVASLHVETNIERHRELSIKTMKDLNRLGYMAPEIYRYLTDESQTTQEIASKITATGKRIKLNTVRQYLRKLRDTGYALQIPCGRRQLWVIGK